VGAPAFKITNELFNRKKEGVVNIALFLNRPKHICDQGIIDGSRLSGENLNISAPTPTRARMAIFYLFSSTDFISTSYLCFSSLS